MKTFCIETPSQLSVLDLVTMGDSDKAGDNTKIGKYASGFKYTIALLLRNGVTMTIYTVGADFKNPTKFEFDTSELTDAVSGKTKTVITVVTTDLETGKMNHQSTGFAVTLGLDWELGFALRELASNMIDEGGQWGPELYGEIANWEKGLIRNNTAQTYIHLSYPKGSEFDHIIENKEHWLLTSAPLFNINTKIEVHANPDGYFKLYKQKILIHEDKNKPSRFIYNTTFGDINEMRVLKDTYRHLYSIYANILGCEDPKIIRKFILSEDLIDSKDVMNDINGYETSNSIMLEVATAIHNEHGNFYTFDCIRKAISSRKDSTLPGRAITSVGDHVWNYSKTVTIDSTPVEAPIVTELTIQQRIEQLYNMKVDCEFCTAEISDAVVIADKYNKCLVISPEFDPAVHFTQFIVQYLDLTEKTNIIVSLSTYLEKLLKR